MKAILLLFFIFQLHSVFAQSDIADQEKTLKTNPVRFISLTGLQIQSVTIEEIKLSRLNWFADTVSNRYYDEYLRLKKALQLKTTLEIINKFSEEGWEFVDDFQQVSQNQIVVTFYFKKLYPKREN
jgi:hypothetical protein